MDGFSAFATVLGVVATAIQVTQAVCILVDDVKGATEDVLIVAEEADAFHDVLENLYDNLQDEQIRDYASRNKRVAAHISSLEKPIRNCSNRLEDIVRALRDNVKQNPDGSLRFSTRLKWSFKLKEDMAQLSVNLANTKNTITTAFAGNTFFDGLRRDALQGNSTPPAAATAAPLSIEEKLARLNKLNSLLRRAAWSGDEAGALLLLDDGAAVDAKNREGRTALSMAAQHGSLGVAKVLIQRGANVNTVSNMQEGDRWKRQESRRTPLHWASARGHEAIVKLLVEHGGDIKAINDSQRTPLIDATEGNHIATMKLLLDRGADVNARTYYGWTMLHSAASRGRTEVAELALKYGADVEALYSGTWHGESEGEKPGKNQRPLHYAVTARRRPASSETAMIELLIQKSKADVQATDSFGATPLHLAARSGWTAAMKVLIDAGAKLHIQDSWKETAFHDAARCGQRDAMILLLSLRGRVVLAFNAKGQTADKVAEENGHKDIARLCRQKMDELEKT